MRIVSVDAGDVATEIAEETPKLSPAQRAQYRLARLDGENMIKPKHANIF